MTDFARSEITNSIWLCRNCHKLIDTDEEKYSSKLLFLWREKHEEFITSTLGTNTDQIIHKELISSLNDFNEYPPIIRRIIIDKPDGWEYRLTAELMRFLNEPIFRKLRDLRKGLYLKNIETLDSENTIKWIKERVSEIGRISKPAVGLMDSLTKSWGKPGEPGDVKEIHHITKLIREYLEQVVLFEERIYFVNVPEEYERLVSFLKNLIGSQVEKLSNIPSDLDDVVALIEKEETKNDDNRPEVIKKQYVFNVPKNWVKDFDKEIKRIQRKTTNAKKSSSGCLFTISIIIFISAVLFF